MYLSLVLCITSCAYTSMAQTFALENGDIIKITLETTGGYKFTSLDDGSLVIIKDDQVISQGGFILIWILTCFWKI